MVKFKSMLDVTVQMYRLAGIGVMPAPPWLEAWQRYAQAVLMPVASLL